MQQRWWIAVIAVLGIGLAVFLFPRPDTGEDIPEADPTNTNPLDFDAGSQGTVRPPRDQRASKPGKKGKGVKGVKPGMERIMELRNRPDAVFAGRLTAPWSAIRYTLMQQQDEDASILADEIGKVLADLQIARRDPTKTRAFDELEDNLADLEEKVLASPWADDETIAASLDRQNSMLDSFHEADAKERGEGIEGEGSPEEVEP
ncbi:MAG TPA: hypothetical protein ENK18_25875 [Deltaproteobacteria bacterium]|nr:hypothetical protein [Deltaproteobacteria bacterium]